MTDASIPRDLRGWARTARGVGWVVVRARNGHVEFRSPTGRRVLVSGSPSDSRSRLNERTRLRRAGLDV